MRLERQSVLAGMEHLTFADYVRSLSFQLLGSPRLSFSLSTPLPQVFNSEELVMQHSLAHVPQNAQSKMYLVQLATTATTRIAVLLCTVRVAQMCQMRNIRVL